MTDERPSERLARESDRLLREWGIDPDEVKLRKAEERAAEERAREATRLELKNQPPVPSPENKPTLGPGNFVNHRVVETPEQREARLAKIEAARLAEKQNEKKPEPTSLDKAAGRVEKIDEQRPARRMLAPWEKDPRWGA